jgi:hypothetical protein
VRENAPVAIPPAERPIRLVVRDEDLDRSRLTVLFRLFLWIPHFVWLLLWGLAANVAAFALWLAILIEGKAPTVLHDFVASYVRYATQVGAYLFLASESYPGFRGAPGYELDVEIDPPARQGRWGAFFRLVLAVPALMLTATLGGGFAWNAVGGIFTLGIQLLLSSSGVAGTGALLIWFAALVLGRAPRGLRDVTAYTLGYGAQAGGYLLLLTDRYPSSDPRLVEPTPELPEHPLRLVVDDDLARSRLTVFFRLLLAIPQFVWIALWSVLAFPAAIAAWITALILGRVPSPLHRFLAAYVRYAMHLSAFVYVIGRKFPGFLGREGSYGTDLRIDPPRRQNRWKTLFRLVLAIPAFLLAGALGSVVFIAAILGWWAALVTGRMPEGLRNLGASCLRYTAQTYAYVFLLTDRYPYGSPVLEGRKAPVQLTLESAPGDGS